jgi:hypothetical protein
MTIRQDVFRALHDAIGWQSGLADAYHHACSPERRECLEQVARLQGHPQKMVRHRSRQV